MSEHTQLPWRASKSGYLMGSDGVGPYGPREVQVGTIGNFFDRELLRFNRDRWQADLELIVSAVNSHEALVKALADIKAATLNGSVCDDVAWFGPGETLHDFCERTLDAVGEAKQRQEFSQCDQCWQPATCKKYGCRSAVGTGNQ